MSEKMLSATLKSLERDGLVGWAVEHFQDVTHGKELMSWLLSFLLVSAIIEQKWSYDYTYALNRQVEVIALVRSFRPIPVDEFDRIARPIIVSEHEEGSQINLESSWP